MEYIFFVFEFLFHYGSSLSYLNQCDQVTVGEM